MRVGVDEAPYVGDGVLGLRLQVEQQRLGGIGITPHQRADGVYGERLARQLRSQAVVQIPAEPAAFLFAGGHEPLARPLQVGGE